MRLRHVPVATLLVGIGCAPSATPQLDANRDLVRRFTEVLNAADWDALDELLTEDFSRHSDATPDMQVTSRAEFTALQDTFIASIPDQRVTIEMMVGEGDKVAVYATYAGTNTGPIAGLPATGKSVALKFLSIFRIEGGRIAELWVEYDNVAMLTQLGLFPPPTPGGG